MIGWGGGGRGRSGFFDFDIVPYTPIYSIQSGIERTKNHSAIPNNNKQINTLVLID